MSMTSDGESCQSQVSQRAPRSLSVLVEPTVCLGGQAAGSSVSLRATILRVADTCHKDLKDTCQNLGTW